MTKLKTSGTSNANETISASSNRNSENASVAAVTKSIYGNGQAPTQFGNAVSSSTKHSNNEEDSDTNDDGGGAGGGGGGGGFGSFGGPGMTGVQPVNTATNAANAGAYDDTNGLYCGPTTARNLFWNVTRVGEINVQPCPPGSTGIAKWRCSGSLLPTKLQKSINRNQNTDDTNDNRMDDTEHGYMWQPSTPDLTQCRSLWLNSLEVRVNQRDSALVSIANDLSQVK